MTWPSSNLYRHLVSSARSAAQPFNSTREPSYGYAVSSGIIEPCEDEVVKQLHELRAGAALYARSPHWYHEEVPETYPSGL